MSSHNSPAFKDKAATALVCECHEHLAPSKAFGILRLSPRKVRWGTASKGATKPETKNVSLPYMPRERNTVGLA